MKLFESLDDLKPFIFRITDNGGATADRFTIITCDGDYFGSSINPNHPQGFFQSGEGIDVMGVDERCDSGEERDLRWIDLPEAVQRAVMDSLNNGFADWLENFSPPLARSDAEDFQACYDLSKRPGHGVYGIPGQYRIRSETWEGRSPDETDYGPYETIREAVLGTLPEDYDLSGPEYHAPDDLWDTEPGPVPLWDRESEIWTCPNCGNTDQDGSDICIDCKQPME